MPACTIRTSCTIFRRRLLEAGRHGFSQSRQRSPQLEHTKKSVMASASLRLVDWKNTASPWLHFGHSTVFVRGSVGSVTTSVSTSVRSLRCSPALSAPAARRAGAGRRRGRGRAGAGRRPSSPRPDESCKARAAGGARVEASPWPELARGRSGGQRRRFRGRGMRV